MRPLRPDTMGGRQHITQRAVIDERQKPNLRGFKIYVGTFVDVDDPGNDPYFPAATPPISTSPSSPPFDSGLTYADPIWFAHGLDGETDMGGSYDISGYTWGDLGWVMPDEWGREAQTLKEFIVKAGPGEFYVAVQEIELVAGDYEVRLWPTTLYSLL